MINGAGREAQDSGLCIPGCDDRVSGFLNRSPCVRRVARPAVLSRTASSAEVGFAAQAGTIRSVPKLTQTCSTESFQVVLPFGIVFGGYLAGDPRQ